jgi:hypothetical protein
MSTNATIGIYNADARTVTSVYLHHDGYRSYAGRMLLEHYTDEEKVRSLIRLGNLSSLYPCITKPLGHSFESPVRGYTVAYRRDRGELDSHSQIQDFHCFRRNAYGYTYLFANGRWVTVSKQGTRLLVLTPEQQTAMGQDYFKIPE